MKNHSVTNRKIKYTINILNELFLPLDLLFFFALTLMLFERVRILVLAY